MPRRAAATLLSTRALQAGWTRAFPAPATTIARTITVQCHASATASSVPAATTQADTMQVPVPHRATRRPPAGDRRAETAKYVATQTASWVALKARSSTIWTARAPTRKGGVAATTVVAMASPSADRGPAGDVLAAGRR